MRKKVILTSVFCLFYLVGNASGWINLLWTDNGPDHLWTTDGNWNRAGSPGINDYARVDCTEDHIALVDATVSSHVAGVHIGYVAPGLMNMTGGYLLLDICLTIGGNDFAGTLHMDGGTMDMDSCRVGEAGGTGLLNMTGGMLNITSSLNIPSAVSAGSGHIQLDGGTINTGTFAMRASGGTGTMDITEGTLVINSNVVSTIKGYIDNGWITAYDGRGFVEITYDNIADTTKISGINLAADFNGDGIIDFEDLHIMSRDWLESDYSIQTSPPDPAGLVSHWTFDNAANLGTDSAGGNNGNNLGLPEQGTGLIGSGSLQCDRIAGVVIPGDSSISGSMAQQTVSLWFKADIDFISHNLETLYCNGEFDERFSLRIGQGIFQAALFTNGTDQAGSYFAEADNFDYNDRQWHHIASVVNATVGYHKLYVDGREIDYVDLGDSTMIRSSSDDIGIGVVAERQNPLRQFRGRIDDVRFYNYALSEAEVASLASAELADELYMPIKSAANLYDDEPIYSKKVNFMDFAVLADMWGKRFEKIELFGNEIEYISNDVPEFNVPDYQGMRYDAVVPDTLDLEESAKLGINGLTGPTDPGIHYEIYWSVNFRANPPWMIHEDHDHVQVKFQEALPLLRLASGGEQNMHIDPIWMNVVLHMQGPDGVLYYPVVGREPWSENGDFGKPPTTPHYMRPYDNGRLLGAVTAYYLLTGDPMWISLGQQIVDGLGNYVVDKGGYAYFRYRLYDLGEYSTPSDPAPDAAIWSCAGWVVQGLTQFYKVSGYEAARSLAVKLAYGLKDHSGCFNSDGSFAGFSHFHHHTLPLLSMAELGATIYDGALLSFAKNGYEYAKTRGVPIVGFFPEVYDNMNYRLSETCEVADMIALGLKLTIIGYGDYWDDIDRWVRNQFIENQLVRADWIAVMNEGKPLTGINSRTQTNDRVPERNIGAFSVSPSANEWLDSQSPQTRGISHCCTGNGARAIYYVWQNILNYDNGELRVNLLLNRASKWADIDSHIPYIGQVDVRIKEPVDLAIRIPEWVTPAEVSVEVNGLGQNITFDGRYAEVGSVNPGDVVIITFPISEQTQIVTIAGDQYTIIRKGNEVVSIDPPGNPDYGAFYQRSHYRDNQTRWRRVNRFVSEQEINW